MLPVMVLLSGCPVGLAYPAGNGDEKIDPALIGTWVTTKEDAEFKKVSFVKKDAYSYTVTTAETGDLYMLDATSFTAWKTTIGGKTFIYSLPTEGEESYYLYCYKIEGKKMYSYDVSLLDGGTDAVTSTEALRKQIETSLTMEDCLSAETEWTKE